MADYFSVHEKHGSLGDFVDFMNHAEALGIRVIVDLVVNHTSIDSPWFRSARADPKSKYRDRYVWADERPKNHREGIVFPGQQTTTWSFDRKAEQYYFHRFYRHQADLNTWNPEVRAEIQGIMGFWLQLGVSGFRLDAVPFLIEPAAVLRAGDRRYRSARLGARADGPPAGARPVGAVPPEPRRARPGTSDRRPA